MKKKVPESSGESSAAPLTRYVIELSPEEIRALSHRLNRDRDLWAFSELEHAHFGARRGNVNLVAYQSGKLVVQGKGTRDFVEFILEPEITGKPLLGNDAVYAPHLYEPHGGLDESGKGDFFGPVVVATVIAANADTVRALEKAGVRDSKQIKGTLALQKIVDSMRDIPGLVLETAYAGMEKFNVLSTRPGANMNRYLGWLHSRALEKALLRSKVSWVLVDQFSKTNWTAIHLKNEEVEVRMETKAESKDPVVAAASIFARAEFLKRMDQLSEIAGRELLKGAGPATFAQAVEIVREKGPDFLNRIAKRNFKTYQQVLNEAGQGNQAT